MLVKEAEDRGLARDPSVREATERALVALLGKEMESEVRASDVTEKEIDAYYSGHRDEFEAPERVVVSQIVFAMQR